MSDLSPETVQALIAKWRKKSEQLRASAPYVLQAAPIDSESYVLRRCADELDTALATSPVPAAERGRAPQEEWQPIETAPTGYVPDKGFQYVLFWGVSAGRSFDHPVIVNGYMDSQRKPVHFYQYKLRITHWMPLPAPPKVTR